MGNYLISGQCDQCKKYLTNSYSDKIIAYNFTNKPITFCGERCLNLGFLERRRVAFCYMCRAKKYNFDMIKQINGANCTIYCSMECLNIYEESTPKLCEECKLTGIPTYKVHTEKAWVFFCSFKCATIYKVRF